MKSYYYVNVIHGDNVRIDGDNNIIVSLQGKQFKSVKVHSASIIADSSVFGLALRLNTYSGNGFSTNRKGVVSCLFESTSKHGTTDYRYSISSPSPEYFISETLNELSFSIIDGIDTVQAPVANFETILLLLELDSD